jgi:hypothetical protein
VRGAKTAQMEIAVMEEEKFGKDKEVYIYTYIYILYILYILEVYRITVYYTILCDVLHVWFGMPLHSECQAL